MAVTRAELIDVLIEFAGGDYVESAQRTLVESIVDDAIEEVRNERFPFGSADESELEAQTNEVLRKYPSVIRRIMEYHYDKIGKEGVTSFYEAGQSTTYEKGGTPPSYLANVIPIAVTF